ncbi:CG3287 [Drosophila busckii]|uniref:CG3287 n=1 Tax=Drosophila busckii TaxID=30019 RepID=A0A0M4EFM8_DROBS|nr:uncharacterized protein LOC108596892 isoform X2 [Drosophila busckii]ALC42188.1 CG3287 [Drosophila busckii]
MSEETYQIETRRRSRSKTPFLRSSCDHENCEHAGEEGHVHHKKKKPSMAPNVQTIVEEHIVETKSSSSSSGKNKNMRSKMNMQATSDYSSDDTTPLSKRKQLHSKASTTTTTSSSVTSMFSNTSKRIGNAFSNLSAVTSTPRNLLETTQNVLNSAQELSASQRSNGDLSKDHLAYIEYRDAGEYWNKTPKTDYTYSELSPHRRQLAPGIIAMPNMSRRSLEHHDERVNSMINRNPTQEDFIRRRYQTKTTTTHLNYDSGDEVDITQFGKQEQSWWLLRFISVIVSTVSSTWNRVTNISETETNAYHNYYANQQRQQQSGFLVRSFSSLLRYIYISIVSVMSLDTWLLRSSNAENKTKKRFLLLLLILLPLLLLAGVYYYLHPNESFPPKSLKLNLNTFTLPELPKINVGEYFNAAQYESLRSQAVEQAVRVRDWADDYLLYLKTIGQNVASKGRQWFQPDNEVYYERV